MKKILLGISLIILGGIIVGSSLIAGSIYSSGLIQAYPQSNSSYDIFYSDAVLAFTTIGSLISIAGVAISIFELKKNEK